MSPHARPLAALPLLGLLALAAPAAAGEPLEIDLLEGYLATADVAPAQPHCARHSGFVLGPTGPTRLPSGGTNAIMEEHTRWHVAMHDQPGFEPSIGDEDRYGEIFLEWHEYFVGMYQRWRADNGHPPLEGWNPATPMPPSLAYPFPERACMDGRDDDPQVPWPTWATLEGGDEADPYFGYTRLCDFPDLNRFGKSITHEWHFAFHGRLGGEMRVQQGPRDPAFWAGHQFLVDVTQAWERECAPAAPLAGAASGGAAVAGGSARAVPGVGAALGALAALGAALAARRR